MALQFTENPRRAGLSATTNPRAVLRAAGLNEASLDEVAAGIAHNVYVSPYGLAQSIDDFVTADNVLVAENLVWNGDFSQWSNRPAGPNDTEVNSPGAAVGFMSGTLPDGHYVGPGEGTVAFSAPIYDDSTGEHYGRFRWLNALTTGILNTDYPLVNRFDWFEWDGMVQVELGAARTLRVQFDGKAAAATNLIPVISVSIGNVVWTASTAVVLNEIRVTSVQRVYRCTTAGTTGLSEPTGTGSGISDGSAVWAYHGELRGSEYELFEPSGLDGVARVAYDQTPGAAQIAALTTTWQSFTFNITVPDLDTVNSTTYAATANPSRQLTSPLKNSYLGFVFSLYMPTLPFTPDISIRNLRVYEGTEDKRLAKYPNRLKKILADVALAQQLKTAVDIDGGAIDGANIGSNSPASITGTLIKSSAIVEFPATINPTLSGDVNDWAPTSLGVVTNLRIDGGAANRNITGISSPNGGRILFLTNIGSTNNITLVNDSSGSSAANRFKLASDAVLRPNQTVTIRYDGSSARWRRCDDDGRGVLGANLTYYVRTDGSDSNSGLVDSAAGAFLTIQKAVNVAVGSIDFAGFTVTIQVRDGTYSAGATLTAGWTGGGNLTIQGNSSTPANVIINGGQYAFYNNGGLLPGALTIKDMKLSSQTIAGIYNTGVGTIQFGGVNFNIGSGAIMVGAANSGAVVMANGSTNTISAAAIFIMAYAQSKGLVFLRSTAFNFSTATALSFAVYATEQGQISAQAATFTGSASSVTGTRWHADDLSLITTGGTNSGLGTGASFFPGNANGSPTYNTLGSDGAFVK